MILKRLYEEYDLAIERMLLKEYKRLKLTMKENAVLLALFSIYKKRRTYSLAALSRRVELSADDIGKAIESLIDKKMITISLESKDGKEREVFDVEPTFIKLETLYIQDEKDRILEEQQNHIQDTIRLFEQGLGRALLSYEYDTIRRWYDEETYTHQEIIRAIESAKDRVSVKHVERLLNQIIPNPIDIDEDVEQALDEIYKSIK